MNSKQRQHVSSTAQQPGDWIILVCAALLTVVSACGPTSTHLTESVTHPTSIASPRYSLVFMIHGDGNYLYHDAQGAENTADNQALRGAIQVALSNQHAEVYIFHQRPARSAFFVFPLMDGVFRYYRNGKLLVHDTYWRGEGSSRFEAEVNLYRTYRVPGTEEIASFFFYFGHEISEFRGSGYDASYPDRTLNTRDMSEALRDFTGDTTTFDLLVLSTCFGGTPHTIASLSPYARSIIASPDNLHLSYFDLRLFRRLDNYMRNADISQFANFFARQAFNRLTNEVQTAVTVAVYDIKKTRAYVNRVDSIYQNSLSELKDCAPGSIEYVDCDEEPAYVLPGMSSGVYILFRPARFGRAKNKDRHSGWQCCRSAVQPSEQLGSIP